MHSSDRRTPGTTGISAIVWSVIDELLFNSPVTATFAGE